MWLYKSPDDQSMNFRSWIGVQIKTDKKYLVIWLVKLSNITEYHSQLNRILFR